uniref:Uncharacterized protein n=1 Tax=Chromera velia CCMP2878 TaxID=1169474 RepID=A0A0G4FM19_9ALVE|eukprot:Cvel_17685.t1-p1 / transcript=Cvel_17685.t1 / gene=Cvel_17685 / organism=Chromera_velia_CCMP2878 / gene_product=hypothetical protein / transcript_product=hypothetical protein / location=Cvel_scaffold1426:40250-46183(-) / protein_length=1657 / sequence_SO=supercontig / SO=protein_coding / is_pseudo=false
MSEEQPSSSSSSSSSSAFIDLPHASAAAGVYTHADLAAAAGTYTTDQAAASYMLYCTNPSGFVPDDAAAAASQRPPRPYPIITVESTGLTSESLPQALPSSHVMIPPPGLALPPGLAPPPGLHPPPGYPQAAAQVQQPDPTQTVGAEYIQPPVQQPSRMTVRTQPLPMFAFDKTVDGEMEHLRRLHDIQRYDEGEPLEHILSDLVPQCVWDEDKVQRGEGVETDKDRDPTPDSRYTSSERARRRERRRALSRERSLEAQNWKLSGAPNELTGNLHRALLERRQQQTEERERYIANDDRSMVQQAKAAWQLIKDSDSRESHTWQNPNANDGRWNPAHDRVPLPNDRPSDEAVKYGRFPKSSAFRAQMEFLAARHVCKDSSISAEKGREGVGEVLGGETKSVSSGGIAEAEQSVEVLVEESKPLLVHLVKEIQSRAKRKLAESHSLLTDLSCRVDSLVPQLGSYIARCKGLIRVLLSDRERYLKEKGKRQKGGKGEVDVDLMGVHGDIRSFLGLVDLESVLCDHQSNEKRELDELERALREFEADLVHSSGVSSSSSSSKPNATRAERDKPLHSPDAVARKGETSSSSSSQQLSPELLEELHTLRAKVVQMEEDREKERRVRERSPTQDGTDHPLGLSSLQPREREEAAQRSPSPPAPDHVDSGSPAVTRNSQEMKGAPSYSNTRSPSGSPSGCLITFPGYRSRTQKEKEKEPVSEKKQQPTGSPEGERRGASGCSEIPSGLRPSIVPPLSAPQQQQHQSPSAAPVLKKQMHTHAPGSKDATGRAPVPSQTFKNFNPAPRGGVAETQQIVQKEREARMRQREREREGRRGAVPRASAVVQIPLHPSAAVAACNTAAAQHAPAPPAVTVALSARRGTLGGPVGGGGGVRAPPGSSAAHTGVQGGGQNAVRRMQTGPPGHVGPPRKNAYALRTGNAGAFRGPSRASVPGVEESAERTSDPGSEGAGSRGDRTQPKGPGGLRTAVRNAAAGPRGGAAGRGQGPALGVPPNSSRGTGKGPGTPIGKGVVPSALNGVQRNRSLPAASAAAPLRQGAQRGGAATGARGTRAAARGRAPSRPVPQQQHALKGGAGGASAFAALRSSAVGQSSQEIPVGGHVVPSVGPPKAGSSVIPPSALGGEEGRHRIGQAGVVRPPVGSLSLLADGSPGPSTRKVPGSSNEAGPRAGYGDEDGEREGQSPRGHNYPLHLQRGRTREQAMQMQMRGERSAKNQQSDSEVSPPPPQMIHQLISPKSKSRPEKETAAGGSAASLTGVAAARGGGGVFNRPATVPVLCLPTSDSSNAQSASLNGQIPAVLHSSSSRLHPQQQPPQLHHQHQAIPPGGSRQQPAAGAPRTFHSGSFTDSPIPAAGAPHSSFALYPLSLSTAGRGPNPAAGARPGEAPAGLMIQPPVGGSLTQHSQLSGFASARTMSHQGPPLSAVAPDGSAKVRQSVEGPMGDSLSLSQERDGSSSQHRLSVGKQPTSGNVAMTSQLPFTSNATTSASQFHMPSVAMGAYVQPSTHHQFNTNPQQQQQTAAVGGSQWRHHVFHAIPAPPPHHLQSAVTGASAGPMGNSPMPHPRYPHPLSHHPLAPTPGAAVTHAGGVLTPQPTIAAAHPQSSAHSRQPAPGGPGGVPLSGGQLAVSLSPTLPSHARVQHPAVTRASRR